VDAESTVELLSRAQGKVIFLFICPGLNICLGTLPGVVIGQIIETAKNHVHVLRETCEC
jgi:hypothetical protein